MGELPTVLDVSDRAREMIEVWRDGTEDDSSVDTADLPQPPEPSSGAAMVEGSTEEE